MPLVSSADLKGRRNLLMNFSECAAQHCKNLCNYIFVIIIPVKKSVKLLTHLINFYLFLQGLMCNKHDYNMIITSALTFSVIHLCLLSYELKVVSQLAG